ncbi:hypothetical protein, partial [Streptomyces scabiei]|uniref:hypothetical protein n=1 Tax=Streptomyces scabiei TaxID=1930 RepID=UPI0038F5F5D8
RRSTDGIGGMDLAIDAWDLRLGQSGTNSNQGKRSKASRGVFVVPVWVPVAGLFTSAALLLVDLFG